MEPLSLGSVLAPAEGLLLPFGQMPEDDLLARPVSGLEMYQPGIETDYQDRIVLVTNLIENAEELQQVRAECVSATALIVHPDTFPAPTSVDAPVVLRRSSWVKMDSLLRALTSLTRSPLTAGRALVAEAADTLERDATLAVHRRESALLALLQGTAEAALPAALVGLRPDQDHIVIAAEASRSDLESLRLALSAGFPEERSVVTEGLLFSVLPKHTVSPAHPGVAQQAVAAELRARLGRVMNPADDLPVGIGSVVSGVFSLHQSAAVARETLRALKFKLGVPALSDARGLRIAEGDDVADALALIRAGDALRPHGSALAAPLTVLAEYDRAHASELLPTILTALEFRSNSAQAARHLGIHANSLRTRLDRIRELSGIDLNEPVSALRAMVAFLANPGIHNEARRHS